MSKALHSDLPRALPVDLKLCSLLGLGNPLRNNFFRVLQLSLRDLGHESELLPSLQIIVILHFSSTILMKHEMQGIPTL